MHRPRQLPGMRAFRSLAVLTGVCALAWSGMASAEDDFEIPLAPLAPTADEDEAEDPAEPSAPSEAAAAEAEAEADPVPPATPSAPAIPSATAVFAWGGGYVPAAAGVPAGPEGGASLERDLPIRGLSLRADLSASFHRLQEAQMLPGQGLDAGFAEVSRLVGLRAGLVWYPLATGRGPYVGAAAGAVLDHTDRRVFSAQSRAVVLRPTAALMAGLGLNVGPGQLRAEVTARGLHLPMGPEGSVVARAKAGVGFGLGYRLAL